MTPAEADQLAKRIINTFHGGPPLDDWREELARLDAGQAGTAYARLRSKLDNAPSIAKFLAEYHSLNTHDGSKPKHDCGWCDNTGWVETRQHVFRGHVYSGCQPCTQCSEGRQRETCELWTKAPDREFITDAEADRLIKACRAAHPSNPRQETA